MSLFKEGEQFGTKCIVNATKASPLTRALQCHFSCWYTQYTDACASSAKQGLRGSGQTPAELMESWMATQST